MLAVWVQERVDKFELRIGMQRGNGRHSEAGIEIPRRESPKNNAGENLVFVSIG